MGTITQQILKDIDDLPPEMQEETLDFVRFLKTKLLKHQLKSAHSESNGSRLAQLMEEASGKKLFADIKDPMTWQRDIRSDRSLPERED